MTNFFLKEFSLRIGKGTDFHFHTLFIILYQLTSLILHLKMLISQQSLLLFCQKVSGGSITKSTFPPVTGLTSPNSLGEKSYELCYGRSIMLLNVYIGHEIMDVMYMDCDMCIFSRINYA